MQRFRWATRCALLLATAPGCYPNAAPSGGSAAVPTVEVIALRAAPQPQTVTLIGRVEPWREAVLYFEVAGVVGDVHVEEGAVVEQDEPIAQLIADDFELALAEVEARRDAAAAQLALLQAGTRKEDLDVARADKDQADAREAFWRSELARRKKLFEEGKKIAQTDFEEAQQEFDAASAVARASQARLDRAVAGPRTQELDAAKANASASQQAVELAKRARDKATIRAPFAGRIERRLLDPGAYINVFPTGGVPVVHLVDLSKADVVIAVPEKLAPKLADRKTIEVASAVDPSIRAPAEVVALGRVADQASGTYALRARIDNADRRFTGSMVARADVTIAGQKAALYIPVTAVRSAYGAGTHVLVVDPETGTARERPVTLAAVLGNRVEVTGGLAEGELLIVRGQHRVVPGDKVHHEISTR